MAENQVKVSAVKMHPHLGVKVSSDGMVFVKANPSHPAHWTKGTRNGSGYMIVSVDHKMYLIHRLVAETFIPNPDGKKQVDHINRDRSDNRVENLRWVTCSENLRNQESVDRINREGRTHKYEDRNKYQRELNHRRMREKKLAWMRFSDRCNHIVSKTLRDLLKPIKANQREWEVYGGY